jgi:hypothetical protein
MNLDIQYLLVLLPVIPQLPQLPGSKNFARSPTQSETLDLRSISRLGLDSEHQGVGDEACYRTRIKTPSFYSFYDSLSTAIVERRIRERVPAPGQQAGEGSRLRR